MRGGVFRKAVAFGPSGLVSVCLPGYQCPYPNVQTRRYRTRFQTPMQQNFFVISFHSVAFRFIPPSHPSPRGRGNALFIGKSNQGDAGPGSGRTCNRYFLLFRCILLHFVSFRLPILAAVDLGAHSLSESQDKEIQDPVPDAYATEIFCYFVSFCRLSFHSAFPS